MPAAASFKYKAFLSYSHADTRLADWLHKRLESYPLAGLTGRETPVGTVPKTLRPIFRDRHDFIAGGTFRAETPGILDDSAALIVLCSPASAKSGPVNEEIRLFKHTHPDRPIVPVILSGKPYDAAQECFPPALRFDLTEEGAVTDKRAPDPIAADIREQGDGRELALAKVVAALIGVASDEVYRRAERERRREARIRNAVVAILLLLAGTGGYFGWRSLKFSGVLIDTAAACSLYLPKDKAPAGPQDPLAQCVSALKTLQKGAAADPRDAEILKLIGEGKREEAEKLQIAAAEDDVAAGIARSKKAAERFRGIAATAGLADPKKARDYYAKAAALDPDNLNGLLWHGDMEKDAGNLTDADHAYAAVLKAGIGGKDDYELYWAGLGEGDILVARGNLAEALTTYRNAAAIADRLAKADPNNAGWQRDLSVSYSKVGNVYRRQGDTAKAKDALNTGKAIMERMTKLSPDNATWKDDLAWFEGQIEALETQSARAAIEAAFEAGDLAKAAALQTDLAAAQEKAEIEKTGAAGAETAEQQGLVSWYRLFTREFGKALAAADRALKLAPDKLWIATNRAHALMFLGRAAEARAVYLGHRGHTVEGQGVWDEAILKDFAEFKKRGLTHPQMAEIKGLLAAK